VDWSVDRAMTTGVSIAVMAGITVAPVRVTVAVAEMNTAQTLKRHDHETGATKHEQECVQIHVAIGAVEGQLSV
jgi:hypothetical protein